MIDLSQLDTRKAGSAPAADHRFSTTVPSRRAVLQAFTQALGSICAFALLSGCDRTESQAVTAERADFQKLVDQIQALGFNVREFQFNGPRHVVFFTDIHTDVLQASTVAALPKLRTVFPFSLVGVEGVIDSPQGPLQRRIEAELHRLLGDIEKDRLGKDGIPGFIVQYEGESSIDSFDTLFDAADFKAVGLELRDLEQGVDLVLYGSTRRMLEGIIEKLSRNPEGFELFKAGERYSDTGLRLTRSLKVLHERHPAVPVLEISRLPEAMIGEVRCRVAIADTLPYLRSLYSALKAASDPLIMEDRNRLCPAQLVREMDQMSAERAVMIFGILHSFSSEGAPSMQNILTELGISYIVVDPPGVTVTVEKERTIVQVPKLERGAPDSTAAERKN